MFILHTCKSVNNLPVERGEQRTVYSNKQAAHILNEYIDRRHCSYWYTSNKSSLIHVLCMLILICQAFMNAFYIYGDIPVDVLQY